MRKIKILLLLILTSLSFLLYGNSNDCGIMRTVPYLQSPTPTSMVVRWVTSLGCESVVKYSTNKSTVDNGGGSTVEAAGTKLIHRIQLSGLTSGATYYYRVGAKFPACGSTPAQTIWSDTYSFKTIPATQSNYSILVLNDLHPVLQTSRLEQFIPRADSIISLSSFQYDLIVFNGDCLDNMDNEEDMIYWIDQFAQLTKNYQIPSVYVMGNHEYDGQLADIAGNHANMTIKKYLDFVKNGEMYGVMNLGMGKLLFLDTGQYYPSTEYNRCRSYFEPHFRNQMLYVDSLKNSNTPIDMLFHHISFFGLPCVGIDDEFYEVFGGVNNNLLNSLNIKLAVNGHTHYSYTCNKNQYKNNYSIFVADGPADPRGTCCGDTHTSEFAITLLRKNSTGLFLDAYSMHKNKTTGALTMITIYYKIKNGIITKTN